MKQYLLDTDIIIYFLNNRHPHLSERILATDLDALHTSIINRSELYYGYFKAEKRKKHLQELDEFSALLPMLAFCESSSRIFAEQKAKLIKTGNILADMDLMIASIAMANDMTLVSNNTKHFNRLKNLRLENWLD
tara:strand:- start:2553 stop:2957 length:405 start_codon:yes stop_codon:yes gene_type:complete